MGVVSAPADTPPLSYNIQRDLELLNSKNINNNISVKLVANPKEKKIYFILFAYHAN